MTETSEKAPIEPDRPIIDPHLHLWHVMPIPGSLMAEHRFLFDEAIATTMMTTTKQMLDQNFACSKELLHACLDGGVPFIYASSAAVYGASTAFAETPDNERGARFKLPVLTFIDTPGAYPGIEAEERGQGEAIARNILEMTRLKVPIIVVIIGEGASGGALGIGVGDKVLMLENTWYSVISPESCSSILWRSSEQSQEAAEALKITARDLQELGVIDEVIPEPGTALLGMLGLLGLAAYGRRRA